MMNSSPCTVFFFIIAHVYHVSLSSARITSCIRAQGLGLGNHMFQFAGAVGLTNGKHIISFGGSHVAVHLHEVFNMTRYSKTHDCRINAVTYRDDGPKCCVYDCRNIRIREGTRDFNGTNVNNKPLRLDGYFQTWKYFEHIKDIIKEEFSFRRDVSEKAQERWRQIFGGFHTNNVIVGVHIRRGDVVKYARYGFKAAPKEYLEIAMDYYRTKYPGAMFLILSNDFQWCKKEIKGKDIKYADGPGSNFAVDLALFTLCNHSIITVGTYGWWGAWLTGGETVYYKKWPIEGTGLSKMIKHQDYFYKGWIGM